MKTSIKKGLLTVGATYMLICYIPFALVCDITDNGIKHAIKDGPKEYIRFSKGVIKTIITGSTENS